MSSSFASLLQAPKATRTSDRRYLSAVCGLILNAHQWFPEVNHHNPDTPILLVGTKLDTREHAETLAGLKEQNLKPVTHEEVSPDECYMQR